VTDIEKALYTTWIRRFGAAKVKELAAEFEAGRSLAKKSEAIVEAKSERDLNALLLEGFRGFFHQTVYLRWLADWESASTDLQSIPVPHSGADSVTLQELQSSAANDDVRCLLSATRKMEFLTEEGEILAIEVPFPVALTAKRNIAIVHVLTMQSTVDTWGEIVGKRLRKMLIPVKADAIHDQALNFMRSRKIQIGDYVDYSEVSRGIIKSDQIDTFSGEFEVGTFGSSKHKTVRGKNKRALRESMKTEYEKLISADRIINAEILLKSDFRGLKAGSKLVLYPTIGKLAFRSHLEGYDPDEFVAALAKT
jgi:hypothetical protein